LGDKEKKAAYDMFGSETGSNSGMGRRSNPFGAAHGFNANSNFGHFEAELSPEDLFNMFFGPNNRGTVKFLKLLGPRPAFRTDGPQFSRNTSNRSSGRDRRTPEFTHVNRSGSYLQLLPVFFLLLFTMISWISGGNFIVFLFLKGLVVLNFLLQSLMLTLMRHIQKNMMLNSLLIRGNIIPSINIISKD
jgi:hypothetical protein